MKGRLRKFLCNVLGWHKPGDEITVRGINIKSVCRYCGKEIVRDSQGNWFAADVVDGKL